MGIGGILGHVEDDIHERRSLRNLETMSDLPVKPPLAQPASGFLFPGMSEKGGQGEARLRRMRLK